MKSNIINRALNKEFSLIAEIGVNYYDIASKYNVSLMEAAKLMVKEAKNAGAHAVKFQSYKAETLASKHSPSYWDTSEESTISQYELFKKYDNFEEGDYAELASYCEGIHIEFLSTAFDYKSADYLDNLMNVYKISSSDLTNIPFIEYQARKNKPIIISTGASNKEEIDLAIMAIRNNNSAPIVLMHCVLEYPTPPQNANLNRIIALKEQYSDLIIGYSDHTKPDKEMDIVKTAYNLGAIVIEKHFTLDKTLKGNDHYHAMDPSDVNKIISSINFINSIRGSYVIDYSQTEEIARRNARRSLVAAVDIPKGQRITADLLIAKRPGVGISPADIKSIVGKKTIVEIKSDTLINFNMLIENNS